MFRRTSQVLVEPIHQLPEHIVFVVRQQGIVHQLEGSLKQARRNVRALVNLSADESDEHDIPHQRSSSKYLFVLRYLGARQAFRYVAPGEGIEPSSSSSKPDVLPIAP